MAPPDPEESSAPARGHRPPWPALLCSVLRRDVLALVGGTRLAFLALTYLGLVLIHDARIFGTTQVGFSRPLLRHWVHWDANWYLGISQFGYGWAHRRFQSPTGFFPLYPALIHTITVVTHLSPTVVGLGLTSVSYALAMLLLHRLCQVEGVGADVAWRTVLYISLFPTAFFFFAPYPEALFLLLQVATFLALRRGQWGRAAIWGALATLTRPPGILLALPFAWEYLAQRQWRLRAIRLDALSVLALPAALGGWAVALGALTRDPLAFAHHQQDWQLALEWPWQTLGDSLSALWMAPPDSFFQAHNLLELGGLTLCVGLSAAGWRRLPRSYTLYTVAVVLLVLLVPAHTRLPLTSFLRRLVVLFPLFIVLALEGRRPWVHTLYLCGATSLLTLFTVVYLNGGFVE